MKKFVTLLLAGLLTHSVAQAQETVKGVCGMSTADQLPLIERMEANRLAPAPAKERGAITYVPIHFHLVGDADGNGKVREARVLDQMCQLNKDYLPLDIQFYLSPHPTQGLFDVSINNNNVYETQSNTFLMGNRRHTKAVNVYVTKEADSGNPNPIGIVLAYYSPTFDWVVSRRDQINGSANNGTLQHEIGHFFSLPHTFFGWESDPFDSPDAGWPIAPSVSPGGSPTEKMDGSNCTTAADRICDTRPDYNFGILASGCANYTGGAKDPMGVLVDPQENNYMGYFSNCDYEFTPGQGSEIVSDLNSNSRNYLDNNFVPTATTITFPTDMLNSPIGGATTQYFDQVTLDWKPVTGATYYLVETDLTSQFATGSYAAQITQNTTLTLTSLKKNTTYFWRVRPFNELYTCGAGVAGNFKTSAGSVSTDDIEAVQEWAVQPNPTDGASFAQVSVSADRTFEANITVTDATGRTVFSRAGQTFASGQNTVELPTVGLANGLYFVSLWNGEARMTKKLVVLN